MMGTRYVRTNVLLYVMRLMVVRKWLVADSLTVNTVGVSQYAALVRSQSHSLTTKSCYCTTLPHSTNVKAAHSSHALRIFKRDGNYLFQVHF